MTFINIIYIQPQLGIYMVMDYFAI